MQLTDVPAQSTFLSYCLKILSRQINTGPTQIRGLQNEECDAANVEGMNAAFASETEDGGPSFFYSVLSFQLR